MKNVHSEAIDAVHYDSGAAKGVTGRVIIGQADGARNFCMRRFDLAPGGYTPRHTHAWEHEIFFHAGQGEVFSSGEWATVGPGHGVFVPGREEHQIRNAGSDPLTFVCLIPSGVPEI